MGGGDIATVARLGANIVALCDVDDERAAGSFQAFPKARRYKDFREMLDKEAKHIDAVTVGTPDHIHAVASMAAIRAGKHVYCQKPLTHTLARMPRADQGRTRRQASPPRWATRGTPPKVPASPTNGSRPASSARSAKSTSGPTAPAGSGNRASADPPTRRRAVARSTGTSGWARSASGPTTRPMPRSAGAAGGTSAPARWATWAATSSIIPSGPWSSGPPSAVEARTTLDGSFLDGDKPNFETYPIAAIIYYEFPARGELPPVRMTWYDGGLMPPAPAEMPPDQRLPDNGVLYVGSKGKMYHGSHGGMPQLLPRELHDEAAKVPKTMERSPGHYEEWVAACKGGPRPVSNFDYSGPLTEIVLLGVLGLKRGRRLEWDSENLKIKNAPELNYLTHAEYRKGGRSNGDCLESRRGCWNAIRGNHVTAVRLSTHLSPAAPLFEKFPFLKLPTAGLLQ